jgi:hypothetical protein
VLQENYSESDTVKFFNSDNSLWYKFSCYENPIDGKFAYPNKDFMPLNFNPYDFVLVLQVVKKSNDGYEVIVNEETGIVKFTKEVAFMKYLTWEQYVTSVFAVSFDQKINPIFVEPNEKSKVLPIEQDVVHNPVKISGDWLEVRWKSNGTDKSGWIKWRVENQLAIEIHND